MLAARGEYQPSGRTVLFKALRAAAVEGRSPSAPLELTRLLIYRQANAWVRIRLARAWMTAAWAPLLRQIERQDI
jgi:hypothetical protein